MQSSSEDEPTPYMLGDQEMGSTTPLMEVYEPDSDILKDPLMDIKKMHSVSSMKEFKYYQSTQRDKETWQKA